MEIPHFLLLSDVMTTGRSGVGTWRFVLESIEGERHLIAADEEDGVSSERLELLSVVRGLEALDQPSRVTLVTSSRYVRHGFRFGLSAWRDSGWQWEDFGTMVPVPNADLWQRVEQALHFHQVRCRLLRLDAAEEIAESPSAAPTRTSVRQIARFFCRWMYGHGRRVWHWLSDLFFNPSMQICPQ